MFNPRCATMLPVVALTFAACADQATSPSQLPTTPQRNVAAALPQPTARWTIDDEFARLAKEEVPGFGGFFFDEHLTPVVYLTDPSRSEAARQFVEQVQGRLNAPARGMVVLQARYDFAELKSSLDRLLPLLSQDGVVWLDIDETMNQLRIAVESETIIAAVRQDIAASGIPLDAVSVEVHPRPVPRIALWDRVRPVDGGYQLHVDTQEFGLVFCTLGVNAMHDGQRVFVSASHCSVNDFSSPDFGPVYQPTIQVGKQLGHEVDDRDLYDCDPSFGGNCRWSDAAAFAYEAGVDHELGFISRTEASAEDQAGTLEVDANNPRFEIVGRTSYEYVEWPVEKVGRTSGWTTGTITQACVQLAGDGGRILRCQAVADLWSQPGDSGSPTFSPGRRRGSVTPSCWACPSCRGIRP